MSEEGKQKWIVRTWMKASTTEGEAQYYADALNAVHRDGYEVYEVDHDRRWVVAYLLEAEEEEETPQAEAKEAPKEEAPRERPHRNQPMIIPLSLEEVMKGGSPFSKVMEMVMPVIMGQRQDSESKPEGSIDHSPKGKHTLDMMEKLHTALTNRNFGDPSLEAKAEEVIRNVFRNVSKDEMILSLEDLKIMHEQHRKGDCVPGCFTDKILSLGEEKLSQKIESTQAN